MGCYVTWLVVRVTGVRFYPLKSGSIPQLDPNAPEERSPLTNSTPLHQGTSPVGMGFVTRLSCKQLVRTHKRTNRPNCKVLTKFFSRAACMDGKRGLECVQMLIRAGANVDATNYVSADLMNVQSGLVIMLGNYICTLSLGNSCTHTLGYCVQKQQTPLHIAAKLGKKELIMPLVRTQRLTWRPSHHSHNI